MREEEMTEHPFELRSYGKRELAAKYNPRISADSAVKMLNRWIKMKPGLSEALEKTGADPACQVLYACAGQADCRGFRCSLRQASQKPSG